MMSFFGEVCQRIQNSIECIYPNHNSNKACVLKSGIVFSKLVVSQSINFMRPRNVRERLCALVFQNV